MLDADEAYFKEHGEPLFSSHMIDLSEEPVDYNIQTTAKYLKRAGNRLSLRLSSLQQLINSSAYEAVA